MSLPHWIQRILDHHGLRYQVHEHRPVVTASRLAEAEHITGHRVAKTVLLNAHNHPVAVVLPASARLDLTRVRGVLGFGDLRLAAESEIAEWFKGCEPGAVPPLRLRGDEQILMDRSLAHLGDILFPAGTQQQAIRMRFRDWYRAVHPGVGRFAESTANGKDNGHIAVLIVEDESDTNQLLCRLLEQEGIPCQGVEAGGAALEAATRDRPAAILLDLMLPDMNGFDLYARLRQTGQQLGVDAYVSKPFEPRALVSELNALLEDDAC
jgi:Ala-tRNA(Pro) deacylase